MMAEIPLGDPVLVVPIEVVLRVADGLKARGLKPDTPAWDLAWIAAMKEEGYDVG